MTEEPISGDRIRRALRGLRKQKEDSSRTSEQLHSILDAIEANTKRHVTRDGTDDDGPATKGAAKYQVDDEIGKGGVGVVYRGRDSYLGREVALKFLRDRFKDDDRVVARFLEEAQICGQLQHPGIVPVLDIGMSDGQLFFAMKMVRGRALSALLGRRGNAMPQAQLLKIFEAVCHTIAYAHARGVIHRDLKPDNIMVGEFGEVQVVDWGMAKVLGEERPDDRDAVATFRSAGDEEVAQTMMGAVLGTPEYMPPEQAHGDRDAMDARSDVFALGAMLLEILTGAPPYDGPAMDDRLNQARQAELDDAFDRFAAAGADPELEDLCRDCLAVDADARPDTAQVVAQRIRDYLASIEDRAEQARLEAAQAETRAVGERKARRLTLLLSLAGLLIVSILAGGWTYFVWQEADRRRESDGAIQTQLGIAASARHDGDWPGALGAIDAAFSIARTGAASSALVARVEREHAELHAAAAATRAAEQRALAQRELERAVQEIRYPEREDYVQAEWQTYCEDYLQAFRDRGLQLTDVELSTAIAAAEDRGHAVELAALIDGRALASYWGGYGKDVEQLVAIANAIDPEPTRVRLREHFIDPDTAAVVAMAEREDVTESGPMVTVLLGRLLITRGQAGNAEARTAALRLLRRAYEVFPRDFAVNLELARALSYQQPALSREAARYFQAARSMAPESVQLAHEYGRLLDHKLGESKRAIELFEFGLRQEPDNAHLWWHIGLAHQHLGDHVAAEKACRKAMALDAKDIKNRVTLAQTLRRARRPSEALPLLDSVLEDEPKHNRAWAIKGHTLDNLGRLGESIEAYAEAMQHAPDSATAYNYGFALYRSHRDDEARTAFEKALELDPRNAGAQRGLADLLREGGETDAAIEAYRAAIRMDPRYSYSHANLGLFFLQLKRFDEGMHHLREAWRLGHRDPSSKKVAGMLRQAFGKDPDAKTKARALELAKELEGKKRP